MRIWKHIIEDNRIQSEDAPALEAKLFFEGEKRLLCLERFTVLLLLSTIIKINVPVVGTY